MAQADLRVIEKSRKISTLTTTIDSFSRIVEALAINGIDLDSESCNTASAG
jgi:hypothetical protein